MHEDLPKLLTASQRQRQVLHFGARHETARDTVDASDQRQIKIRCPSRHAVRDTLLPITSHNPASPLGKRYDLGRRTSRPRVAARRSSEIRRVDKRRR